VKVAFVGSRTYLHLSRVWDYVYAQPRDTEIVTGTAWSPEKVSRVDETAHHAALTRGMKVTIFPADWLTHGKAAGPLRNTDIVDYADAVIAFYDGQSKGTGDVIRKAERAGKPVQIVRDS
jgi:hypothetical protein